MLRNPYACTFLLRLYTYHQRHFHQHNGVLYNKSTSNVLRQGKIMGKLFGSRVTGSKKSWFPQTDVKSSASGFQESQFGKTPNSGGKNVIRRMTVLNKLFMTHITDLMATGEISESLLGKGLQISRVKISQDFAFVNVFWLASGDSMKDALLEHELQRCSGLLRHELSQLGLMGVVPRIKFVRDKVFTNSIQVEALLKNMDFGEEEDEVIEEYKQHATDLIRNDFYYSKEKSPTATNSKAETNLENINLPQMRHDVLGLDHKGIMLKIYAKMRKSKQAWEQHHQRCSDNTVEIVNNPETQLDQVKDKLEKSAKNSDKFESFLAKRRERKNTPERKKHREMDHRLDLANTESQEFEVALSNRQRQLYEAEDYLSEDVEDKKI